MKRLLLWIVNHPKLIIPCLITVTILLGSQIPKLEVDASSNGLMMEHDPLRSFYEDAVRTFGDDTLTVVVVKAENVLTAPVLRTIQRITNAIEKMEEVSRVESLTTVTNIEGEADWLRTDPLVGEQVLDDPVALEHIRRDAMANPIFVGSIVSANAQAAAINIYVDSRFHDKTFNQRLSEQIEGILRAEAAPGISLYQIGMPLAKATLARFSQQDLLTLCLIGGVVVFMLLYGILRMGQAATIPMVTGMVSIVWALGAMALLRLPINIFTATIPGLILAIGFTEDIHMVTEYYRLLRQGHGKLTAVREMVSVTALPVLIVTATTIAGFASLMASDITMLIQFGQASVLGLVSNFLITITVVPLILRFRPVPNTVLAQVRDTQASSRVERALHGLGNFTLRWRLPLLVAYVGIGVLGAASMMRLKVNTDFVSYFREGSFIRQRTEDLHASMAGALSFYVILDTHQEDGVTQPEVLRRISQIQSYLAADHMLVDKTISIADYVKKMHREMNNGDPTFETTPDSSDLIAQYLLLMDRQDIEKYIDVHAAKANILVRHNVSSSWQLSRLLQELEAYMSTQLPQGVTFRYTGEEILINHAADSMAINMVQSLLWTFVAILIIHGVLFRSPTLGLLSLVPNLAPIFANFGLMGLLGIPLNTGTVMIGEITLGIIVDDTVHYMCRYQRELARLNDVRHATLATLESEGLPILTTSVALAGGFWVLMCSRFVPTASFGALSGITMLIAMVSELTLSPIVMSWCSTRIVNVQDVGIIWLLPLPQRRRMAPRLFKEVRRDSGVTS